MLKFDPRERFSAQQCLQSPIFENLLKNQEQEDIVGKYKVEVDDDEIINDSAKFLLKELDLVKNNWDAAAMKNLSITLIIF